MTNANSPSVASAVAVNNLTPIRELIRNKTPLLIDGAMGTELYNKGMFINRCFEEANISNPTLVREIHENYVRVGAQVLTTNSWGANRIKLTGHNLHDKTYEINFKAAALAREAIGNHGYVAGSVGPLGVRLEPWGPTSFDEAKIIFREQIQALVDGGVDFISLETFAEIAELQQAVAAVREVSKDIPIVAHLVINPDGNSPLGTPIEWAIKKLDEWKVDVVGLNCSVGPQPMMSALPRIRKVTELPVSFQPNAGLPKIVDGRSIYLSTPEYMAKFTKDFLQAGVLFVGGCCGTTPEHTRAMANAFRQRNAMDSNQATSAANALKKSNVAFTSEEKPEVSRVTAEEKSNWARKIAKGERVLSVELLPPQGVRPTKIIEQSKKLKAAGIDAINIPDGPRASARMSAILTAVMIEQRAGIETVLHYTCRDRNLLGMQSDMLGAHAIGLRNLLLVTGDPPKMGAYPNATGVFDVDAIGLTNMVYKLNGGVDLGERAIGEPTALSIGVGVNPVHRDFEYEMKRFKYKVEAGAEWAITQPVFDAQALFKFMEYLDRNNLRIPIIAGVWPLLSHRNAVFMNNEVPGVIIPPKVIERMAVPTNAEDAKKVGVDIAREMVEELGSSVQGLQLSAPFGRIDLALAIVGK